MIIIISFVFYTFFTSLLDTSYDFQYLKNEKDSKLRHLQLFGSDISKLCGMLPLGFFSHSIILPILKNNRYQENNKRDVFLGYSMVAVSYILMGISGYVGFSGSKYDPELFGSVRNIKINSLFFFNFLYIFSRIGFIFAMLVNGI